MKPVSTASGSSCCRASWAEHLGFPDMQRTHAAESQAWLAQGALSDPWTSTADRARPQCPCGCVWFCGFALSPEAEEVLFWVAFWNCRRSSGKLSTFYPLSAGTLHMWKRFCPGLPVCPCCALLTVDRKIEEHVHAVVRCG